MKEMRFAPGSLVAARGREWVVLPDSTSDFLVLRPLGGMDDDIAGVLVSEGVQPATFPPPVADDLGEAGLLAGGGGRDRERERERPVWEAEHRPVSR